jgi:hypothetical protein
MTNARRTVEHYLERARLARERATLLSNELAKTHEIKLAESYEWLARDASNRKKDQSSYKS